MADPLTKANQPGPGEGQYKEMNMSNKGSRVVMTRIAVMLVVGVVMGWASAHAQTTQPGVMSVCQCAVCTPSAPEAAPKKPH